MNRPPRSASAIRLAAGILAACAFPARAQTQAPGGIPLTAFFDSAYASRADRIGTRLSPLYRELCQAAGADAPANRSVLMPLLFRHGLLTATDAIDCRRGGALGTVYFWHWVSPNPRHALRRLPDSSPLVRLPPPPGFGKYKSWADVDRLPSLYLGDLAAERPRYFHPRCGAIETFGWCSEREMAFASLLAIAGVRAKIKQEGIHVWTEALLELRTAEGKTRPTVVAFDNTFATVEARPLRGSAAAWERDFGSGSDVAWYNRVAHSPEQAARVKAVSAGPEAAKRMLGRIDAWLNAP